MPAPTGMFATPCRPSQYRLTIELIPERAGGDNVRSAVSKSRWGAISKLAQSGAGGRCEICGDSPARGLECHEVWVRDVPTRTQSLAGLQALCKDCHLVKHLGVSSRLGLLERSVLHLATVNGIGEKEARAYVQWAFKRAAELDRYRWRIDISALDSIEEGLRAANRVP